MRKIFAIIFVSLLAACSSNQPPPATLIPSLEPLSNSLPTETILPAAETSTPTSAPPPIVTTTPLWTPFPTLSSTEAEERLRFWIPGQFDCLLPCWGGITPGVTNWQEARQVIEQLSGFATVNISENIGCEFGACNGIAWSLYPATFAEGVFYTNLPENKIHLININIQKINLLRDIGLQDALQWYGLPPIFLINIETDPNGNRFMKLVLVYPKRQSMIRYTKPAELVDGRVTNCGQDHQMEMIILDNKEQLSSLDAIVNAVETRDLGLGEGYLTVQEATGISPNTFYNTFSTIRDACISTPVEMWTP